MHTKEKRKEHEEKKVGSGLNIQYCVTKRYRTFLEY
jgi:hypothetical protein